MYSDVKRSDAYIGNLSVFINTVYDLQITAIKEASRGFYGETWRIESGGNSYFVKLDYSSAHKKIYRNSFHVIDFLCENGIDFIGKIVKTRTGNLYAEYDGAVLGVFEWIEGDNIQDDTTKIHEYKMLSKIYTIAPKTINIPCESLTDHCAGLFYRQWEKLERCEKSESAGNILSVFNDKREVIARVADRLKLFSDRCNGDKPPYYITHGDAGGNVIVQKANCGKDGIKHYIIDWDDPKLAPPERDAWFCLHWDWAVKAFNAAMAENGIAYTLRPERMAYYCYHSFFHYLTEYMEAYFDLGENGDRGKPTYAEIYDYFNCWINDEIAYADRL
jgi:hypothetical protein